MSNVTYVSFLFSCPDDRIPIQQRLELLEPLLDARLPLILFVDEVYAKAIGVIAHVKIIVLEMNDLKTILTINSYGELKLPPNRNPVKDTLNFLTYMNCKPELLVIASPHITTPYVAFIDAGISKVLKDKTTLNKLKTLNVHNIPLVLTPGCFQISELEPFPHLWKGINWTFSGGFFLVPVSRVDDWFNLHLNALKKYLEMGTITWEVNVWASFANSVKYRIVWYNGPHDDNMINGIPKSVLLKTNQTVSGDSSALTVTV
jgi:hypothetical protein